MRKKIQNYLIWLWALGAWNAGGAYNFVVITNPAPATDDEFGCSVAAVGPNQFVIGAASKTIDGNEAVGQAYLYTNGVLAATITDPNRYLLGGDYFGNSVAAVGTNQFVIGACGTAYGVGHVGRAYLYTNGVLTATIMNPAPAAEDFFGWSVAAVGTNQFVIGAYSKQIGTNVEAGEAYLYTNGVLAVTITNPAPTANSFFGCCVAGVGTNQFVIGAYGAGLAYLYNATGTLMTAITSPAPAVGHFGYSVAAIGTNQFVIGANGGAYLYTNGVLAVTITNPAPASADCFGNSVAAVGPNQFVIGAWNMNLYGLSLVGQAYLYDTTGTLLATITDPAPAASDEFGWSVAAVGTNQFVIGASSKTIGGNTFVGQVYLYPTTASAHKPLPLIWFFGE